MKRIWMPLPDRDFDTTETAVPWKVLTRAGCEVIFATEAGADGPVAACDPRLLSGVVFGKLGAEPEPKAWYAEMMASPAYRAPVAWATIRPDDFDALVLPGGHAPGMRQYLGSEALQAKVAAFFAGGKPVGAICHGPWVLCSTPALKGKKATCFFAIKDDVIHAGADYTDAEVVVDKNLVTSRKPDDLPAFMEACLKVLKAPG